MENPLSAPVDRTAVGVIIPIRSLASGKNRLSERLDLDRRRALIASMAETVIRAAHDLDVLVVHTDDAVGPWAANLGAHTAQPPEPGLNEAVEFGRRWFGSRDASHVLVAHADLPFVRDLRVAATFPGVTIAPDRHREGTNVMCVPIGLDLPFRYGPGSFAAHRRLAVESGASVRILDEPSMAWDVDHPSDLRPDVLDAT